MSFLKLQTGRVATVFLISQHLCEELKENIKRHYGSTDEDLADLAQVMDAITDIDKLEAIKAELETAKLDAEQKLKALDTEWRNRYRERFFDGDVTVDFGDDLAPEEDHTEDISIEEYLDEMKKG